MSADEEPEAQGGMLPVLLRLYLPVMLLSLLVPAFIGGVVALLIGKWVALALPVIFVVFSALHMGYLFFASTKKMKREKDWFEMTLEPELKVRLREFIVDIARRWNMPRPEEIRLSADSAAHVYESKRGKRILVIGGMAIAALSREALGAVIAHELTHFEGGDTTFPWANLTGFTMMHRLGFELGKNVVHFLDPAVWPVGIFHYFVTVSHAKHSREREFRCDARSARHAGKTPTAAALIYLHVVNNMPWANMMSVLETSIVGGSVSHDVFTEQARRAAGAPPEVWRDETDDEMDKDTKLFDDHPCLRERLEAIDATAKEGLKYLLNDESPPARTLVKDWHSVEKKLGVKLTSMYQLWREERYGWGGLVRHEDDD
jgi:Zn-dependent protease with chaperone function